MEPTQTVMLNAKQWEVVSMARDKMTRMEERLSEKKDAHASAKKDYDAAVEAFTEAFDELTNPTAMPLFQQVEANEIAVNQPWVKTMIARLDEAEGLPADSGKWGTRALEIAGWTTEQATFAGLWCDQMELWKKDANATMDSIPTMPDFMQALHVDSPATEEAVATDAIVEAPTHQEDIGAAEMAAQALVDCPEPVAEVIDDDSIPF